MIKRGIFNFFKSLRYYLTPFGAVLLFMAFGLTIAITNIANSVSTMLDTIKVTFAGAEYNWSEASQTLLGSILAQNWKGDLFGSLANLVKPEYLSQVLGETIKAAFGRDDVTYVIKSAVDACISDIITQFVVFIIFVVLGLAVGFIFTRMQVRHEIAPIKGKPGRVFLRILLDAVVFVINIILLSWLISVWSTWAIWLVIGIVAVIYPIITLFKAFLIHGRKHIKLKEVMNPLQVLFLYIADIIILAFGIFFIVFFYYLVHPILGVFLGIPLVMITIIVVDLNAESYVHDKAIGTDETKIENVKKQKEKRRA